MTRKTKTARDTFPITDDVSGACARAETILEHYGKARGQSRGDLFTLVARAMADLAILSDVEYGIAWGEARAEGGDYPHGHSAESACDEAGEIARETLNDDRLRREDAEYARLRLPQSIFPPVAPQPAGSRKRG
jgi:hypothetical protein